MNDGAAIYSYLGNYNEPGIAGSEIKENIILNVFGNSDGTTSPFHLAFGVYLDHKTHDVTIKDNLIAKSSGGVYIYGGRNIISNNTFFDCLLDVYSSGQEQPSTFTSNIMFKTQREGRLVYLRNTHQRFVDFRNGVRHNFDYNTYVAPYIKTNVFVQYSSFAQWQASGHDAHGTFYGADMKTNEVEQLFYNDTKQNKTFNLGGQVYKDIYGNQVSGSLTLSPFTSRILIQTNFVSDNTRPVVTSFVIPATAQSLTVPVTSFSASDNIGVTGYMITESSAVPGATNPGWMENAPASYTFSSGGLKTVYAWAKDGSGNISSPVSRIVDINLSNNTQPGTAGNTQAYNQTSIKGNRRAIPAYFSNDAEITSISVYHNGGTGNMLVAVYTDNNGNPGSMIGVSSQTRVNSSAGWQTVNLNSNVAVATGKKVWLAWVFENNPGVRYAEGDGIRAQSSQTWNSGMP
ncbi:MAG: hypothetical protein GX800_11510, partial [Clostridiaceae bacterium]|nr:hypothetical protein [Clostridiaceae bacterium]